MKSTKIPKINVSMNFSFIAFVLLCLLNFSLIPSMQSKAAIDENPEAVSALAKCLKSQGATMYGTRGCGHCERQKEAFGSSFRDVRYIDCRGSGDNSRECAKAKVGKFPQWNFENGRTLVREQTLDTIAKASGCDVYVAKAIGGADKNTLQAALNQTNSDISYNSKPSNNNSNSVSQSVSYTGNSSYGSPEALAKCLKDEGVKFYGSPKCGHCNRQKEMFEGAFEQYMTSNFHNCKGSGAEQAECSKYSTFPFPTWRNPNTGKQLNGPERRLDVIAQTFDCTLEAQARKRGSTKFAQNTNQSSNQNNSYQSNNNQQAGSFDIAVNNQSSISTEEQSISNEASVDVSTNTQEQLSNIASDSTSSNSEDKVANEPVSKPQVEDFQSSSNQIQSNQAEYNNASNDQSAISQNTSYIAGSERYLLDQKQNKLAKCIADKNIILYGITNESIGKPIQYKATQTQLEELGVAAQKIKVVDCSLNQADCSGILVYPTWILDDKKELAGVYELSNLAQILNCDIEN